MVFRRLTNEGLFSLIGRRANLVRRILSDGSLDYPEAFIKMNYLVAKSYSGVDGVFGDFLFDFSENYPDLMMYYGLQDRPFDMVLRGGCNVRDAISFSRVVRAKKSGFEDSSGNRVNKLDNLSFAVNSYVSGIISRSSYGSEEIFESLENDISEFNGLKEKINSFCDSFFSGVLNGFYLSKEAQFGVKDVNSSKLRDRFIRLVSSVGEVELKSSFLRRFGLRFLDSLLVPYGEYDFGGENDSWRLFRSTFMSKDKMNFGFVDLNYDEFFPLYVFNHSRTNAISALSNLSNASVSLEPSLNHSLFGFSNYCCGFDSEHRVDVFSVPFPIYLLKKKDWYFDLIKRFGSLSSVSSVYGDKSLYLKKYGSGSSRQSMDFDIVNHHLRKLLHLAGVLGGYDVPLNEAYEKTKPIIENYEKEVFEENLGVLVSDVSSFDEARNFLFLPSYFSERYPSIGVSRSRYLDGSIGDDIKIAVRSGGLESSLSIENSVYSVLGGRKIASNFRI